MLKKLWFLITSVPGLTWARHPGDIYLRLADGREPMPKWLDKAVPWLLWAVLFVAWLVSMCWVFAKNESVLSAPADNPVIFFACIGGFLLLGAWLVSLQHAFIHAWRLRNLRLAICTVEGVGYATFCRVRAGTEKLEGELARGHCHWFWGPGPLPGWDVDLIGGDTAVVRDSTGGQCDFPAPPAADRLHSVDATHCRLVWHLYTECTGLAHMSWKDVLIRTVLTSSEDAQEGFSRIASLERALQKSAIEARAGIALVHWLRDYFQGTRSIHAHKRVGDLLAGEVPALMEDHIHRLQEMLYHDHEPEGAFYPGDLYARLNELDWPGLKPDRKKPKPA